MNRKAAIVSAIHAGANRTAEIAECTRIPREIVQTRLAELVRRGRVSAFRTITGHIKHANEKFYRIRGELPKPQTFAEALQQFQSRAPLSLEHVIEDVELAFAEDERVLR